MGQLRKPLVCNVRLRETSSVIAVSSGVLGVLDAADVNASRNVAGTMRERGSLTGTVSPETLITASSARVNSPPAGRGERPAGTINASARAAPSCRTNGRARDAPDETAGCSVVSFTSPRRYTVDLAPRITPFALLGGALPPSARNHGSKPRQTQPGSVCSIGEAAGGLDYRRVVVAVDGSVEPAVAVCVCVAAGAVGNGHRPAEAGVGAGRA